MKFNGFGLVVSDTSATPAGCKRTACNASNKDNPSYTYYE